MEKISLWNGNNQRYTLDLPKIMIQEDFINEVALNHILKNTGMKFIKVNCNYEAQPTTSKQITKLFLTYNYKTRYYNNIDIKNTLILKGNYEEKKGKK